MPATGPTVEEALRAYDASLQIRERREGAARKHSQEVLSALKKAGLAVLEARTIGSYTRHTLIPPLEAGDVDLMMVLNAREHRTWDNAEGAASALRKCEAILARQFPRLRVELARNAATVIFPEFRLDVIPAFAWHSGGFLIPDADGPMWLHSDPEGFAERLTELNNRHNGLIAPVIRMVKAWNREADSLLEGFHIECLVYRHFSGAAYSRRWVNSFAQGLHEFFAALPSLLSARCAEPVYDEQVDRYLDSSHLRHGREQAVDMASDAAELAGGAHQQQEDGLERVAVATWRQLFGKGFPA